jgi:hypothetical protein
MLHRYIFTLHTSFDGSFQLFRKDKSYDRWDICLTDGRKYFVDSKEFNIDLVPSQGSTRVSNPEPCLTKSNASQRMQTAIITVQQPVDGPNSRALLRLELGR